jgi:hypothetical protein
VSVLFGQARDPAAEDFCWAKIFDGLDKMDVFRVRVPIQFIYQRLIADLNSRETK